MTWRNFPLKHVFSWCMSITGFIISFACPFVQEPCGLELKAYMVY